MPSWIVRQATGRLRTWLIYLALILATVAAYWRVKGFDFLNFDDFSIFFGNPYVRGGWKWPDLQWAFTTNYYEYWHPFMWLSHMLDCQLFGLRPGWHHVVNLALHLANTLLVFAVFRRLTGMIWRSAVVAALFALHPLHVESVAWLAERKDLLSTFFALLSVRAYVKYVELSKVQSPKPKVFQYCLALLFFLFGLLTKPMVVTLPFVLLLLDYWPLGRNFKFQVASFTSKTAGKQESLAGLVWEKLPFFALTVIFCWTTWYSVSLGNQIQSTKTVPWELRLTNIPVAYMEYLWKTVYPANLAVLYPLPQHWNPGFVAGATAILLAISWLVLARFRRFKYLAFGWLMFLGVLFPTIGIVPVGAQAYADRYMYLPSIGLFVALVWGMTELAPRWRLPKTALAGATASITLACGVVTWTQTSHWQDSLALWTHCLATGAESVQAHYNLGQTYLDLGQNAKAIEQYRAALRQAAELDLTSVEAQGQLAQALVANGSVEEGIATYRVALQSDPNRPETLNNLAWLLATCREARWRNGEEAVKLAERACEQTSRRHTAYMGTLSAAYAEAGQFEKAVETSQKACELASEHGEKELLAKNQELLRLFKNGQAYH